MNHKIAFSDIDGTLLNAEREPSMALKTEVARLAANDIPFILISSRMPQAMTWIQDDLGITGLPLVCYNGGLVMVDGRTIHSRPISMENCIRIHELAEEVGKLSFQLFHSEEWYVESMGHYAKREQHNTRVAPLVRRAKDTLQEWSLRPHGAHKVMVMGGKDRLDRLVGLLEYNFDEDELHLYRSKDDYLEIASKDISKLTGIEYVLSTKYPGLSLADCIAFGDNYNDVEMLKGVGMGVAVANAKPEVLAIADSVTGAAKEDGVALALERLVSTD